VWELPEIKPHVAEYLRHRLTRCGEMTCAESPVGVLQGQPGPRLIAFTVLWMAFYHQTKQRTAEFFSTLLEQTHCSTLTATMPSQMMAALRLSYGALAA
jgi:transposase